MVEVDKLDEDKIIESVRAEILANGESVTIQHIHETHRKEVNLHREAMLKSVQWSTNVYLAVAGGLLLLGSDGWRCLGQTGLWFGIIVVAIIAVFVIAQLLHSADAINSNARVIVKTDEFMGLFDSSRFLEEDTIYPLTWREWGQTKKAGYYEKFHIGLVVLLAMALIIFMWVL